jgi:hypothetical protein
VPGTSNHGWALAVDTGEERDNDAGTESLDAGTLNWLLAHALDFGWSWELQSEPWHLRCFVGDAIPAAVLAHERGEAMTPEQESDVVKGNLTPANVLHFRLRAIQDSADPELVRRYPKWLEGAPPGLKQIGERLSVLESRPPVEAAPVDPAAIEAAMLSPRVLSAIAEATADVLARRAAE